MTGRQISLTSLLLLLAAVPLWLAMIVLLPMSPGFGGGLFRFAVTPLVLAGVTWALHRLLRSWRDGWAISALLAAIICFGTLSLVASIAD